MKTVVYFQLCCSLEFKVSVFKPFNRFWDPGAGLEPCGSLLTPIFSASVKRSICGQLYAQVITA